MFETGTTLVTDTWPLVSVRAHVSLEVNPLSKGSVARVTFIGSLASVRPDMSLKIGREHRRVGTVWTAVQDHAQV